MYSNTKLATKSCMPAACGPHGWRSCKISSAVWHLKEFTVHRRPCEILICTSKIIAPSSPVTSTPSSPAAYIRKSGKVLADLSEDRIVDNLHRWHGFGVRNFCNDVMILWFYGLKMMLRRTNQEFAKDWLKAERTLRLKCFRNIRDHQVFAQSGFCSNPAETTPRHWHCSIRSIAVRLGVSEDKPSLQKSKKISISNQCPQWTREAQGRNTRKSYGHRITKLRQHWI